MADDPLLRVDRIVKKYGEATAVGPIDLAVEHGEFLTPVSYTHLTLPTIYSV